MFYSIPLVCEWLFCPSYYRNLEQDGSTVYCTQCTEYLQPKAADSPCQQSQRECIKYNSTRGQTAD